MTPSPSPDSTAFVSVDVETAGPATNLLAQSDHLILSVVRVLEGEQEVEIVRHLLRLRDSLVWREFRQDHVAAVEAARAEVINVVNNFFYDRLIAVPTIRSYIDSFETRTA